MSRPIATLFMAGLLPLAASFSVLASGLAVQEPEPLVTAPVETTPAPETELGHGKATWYGLKFHGRRTASGERFDMNEMTAAHETLPLGTKVRVRNMSNGREVEVRINDRAPRLKDRVIDLSKAAAAALGFVDLGRAPVVLMPHWPSSPR